MWQDRDTEIKNAFLIEDTTTVCWSWRTAARIDVLSWKRSSAAHSNVPS